MGKAPKKLCIKMLDSVKVEIYIVSKGISFTHSTNMKGPLTTCEKWKYLEYISNQTKISAFILEDWEISNRPSK